MSLLWIQELDGKELEYSEKIYLFGTKACVILFNLGMYELCSALGDSIYPSPATDSWKTKIMRAYRLFSYAFATAEDGGKTIIEDGKCKVHRIERPDFQEKEDRDPNQYHSDEVDSLRDLYPHRITEIADLGKVYAIACNLVLMYLLDQKDRQKHSENIKKYSEDIQNLINKFHDISRMLPELADGQLRFNGYLAPYLKRIQEIVERELEQFDEWIKKGSLEVDVEKLRERIIEDFFASFYRQPSNNLDNNKP